jgi:hypothetical protein
MRRAHRLVYITELSKDVPLEPRSRRNNPGNVKTKLCVYVGMTRKVAIAIDLPAPTP